jgi:hypothetical protein
MALARPNPLQWLHYSFGGRLPDRYRDWVLHDATTRTWLWRFVARVLVQTAPWLVIGFVLLVLLTPLPAGLVVGALSIGLATTFYFTVSSADELTEARLVKQGFEPGTGKRLRRERSAGHR